MLFLFYFSNLAHSSIPKEYRSLVEKAQKAATIKRSPALLDDYLDPNFYDYDGISFTLNDRLISPNVHGIRGHSLSNNVLALVLDSASLITSRTVYIDPSSQGFYRIKDLLGTEGTTSLYSVSPVDPTMVLTNLRMNTAPLHDSGYNCDFDVPNLGTQCRAWYGVNWDEGKPLPNPRPTTIPDLLYYAGAIGEASGSANVHFHGLRNIEVDFSFALSLTAGLGLEFNRTKIGTSFHVADVDIPLYGKSISILGVKISFGLNAFIGFDFNELSIELPQPLLYFRSYNATLSRTGSYTTGSGISSEPWDFSITPGVESTLPKNVSEFFKTIVFDVSPGISAGISLSFIIGSAVDSSLKLGGTADFDFKFSADKDLCAFPYLIGTAETKLGVFIQATPLTILGHDFIKPFSKSWNLWDSGVSPKRCLISKSNALNYHNNFKALTSETKPLYVSLVSIHQEQADMAQAILWISQCSNGNCESLNTLDLGSIETDTDAIAKGFDKFQTTFDPSYDLVIQLNLDGTPHKFEFPSYFFTGMTGDFQKLEVLEDGKYGLNLLFRSNKDLPISNKLLQNNNIYTSNIPLPKKSDWTVVEAKNVAILLDHNWIHENYFIVQTKDHDSITYSSEKDGTIKKIAQFDGTKDGFCHSDTINNVQGCIEMISENEFKSQIWQPLGLKSIPLGQKAIILTNESPSRIAKLTINLENKASMIINENKLEKVYVKCERCSRIARIENGNRIYLEKSNDGFILSNGEISPIIAECDDSNEAYCEVKEPFSLDGFTLYSLPSPNGIDVRGFHGLSKAIGVFSNATFVKNWKGKVERKAKLSESSLSIHAMASGKLMIIQAKFGNYDAPFGENAYMANPTAFIDAFADDSIGFTEEGLAIIHADKADSITKDTELLKSLFDIPSNYIKDVNLSISKALANKKQQQPFPLWKILTICAAGVALIIIIVSVVVTLRFKKKKEQEKSFSSSLL